MFSPCQIGAGLITGSVLVSVFSTQGKKEFVATLSEEQLALFREICRSRLAIYIGALAIGGLLGWILFASSSDKSWTGVCPAVGVAAFAAYFVYKLYPKQKWMLNYLNIEQTRAWLEMYKTMSVNFHGGFLVGMVGYAILLKGLCPSCPA
jgi:hypothetical protein